MSTVQELLEDLDMESWLDYEGVRYKRTRGRSGLQLNVRECPCCGNAKWKVYLGAESGLGNCFVCEERFTKWKFLSSVLNIAKSDLFKYIEAFVASNSISGPKAEYVEQEQKPELLLPESMPLPIDGRNLKYLEDRHITSAMASYYQLRYCHNGVFKYVDGYGNPAEQNYSHRIIIPIFDIDGSFVSFQGRDITGLAPRKYLFPPQFASTGSVLYDAHRAKEAGTVVIGEGVFDAFAIKAAIDSNIEFYDYASVASFGKSLGKDQIEKLRTLQREGSMTQAIFMWDGEQKAIEAAVDAALSCKSYGIHTKVALLPKGCDPNEVSPETVLQCLRLAKSIDSISAIRIKLNARANYS